MITTIEKESTSQKLIRCMLISKNKTTSKRYVEVDHYKLWSYMMFHKHGMKIKDKALCLWVKEQEFLERQEIYSRFSDIDEVNKIELFLFDDMHGFSHTIYRFVEKDETSMLKKVLLSHISPEISEGGNYEMNVQNGFCIKSGKNDSKMVLGLSDSDERIWYRKY